MFGRSKIVRIISSGNLNKLKKYLENDRLSRFVVREWPNKSLGKDAKMTGNMLHMAAYFNQPEIIRFLVNEYHMNVNQPNQKSQRTPLHRACEQNGFEAASLLLYLGADPTLRCSRVYGLEGGTAYELSRDERIKALLRPAHEQQMQQEAQEGLEREAECQEQECAAAKDRIRGTWHWNPASPSEIDHEYDSADGLHHVKDIFNFAAGRLTSVFKDLRDGGRSHSDSFFNDDDIPKNETLREAFARLNEMASNGNQPSAGPDVLAGDTRRGNITDRYRELNAVRI